MLPYIHPSSTQEVPEVCFWWRSIVILGSFSKYIDLDLAPQRLCGIRLLHYMKELGLRLSIKCAFSGTENYLSRHGMGFDNNVGTSVSFLCQFVFLTPV